MKSFELHEEIIWCFQERLSWFLKTCLNKQWCRRQKTTILMTPVVLQRHLASKWRASHYLLFMVEHSDCSDTSDRQTEVWTYFSKWILHKNTLCDMIVFAEDYIFFQMILEVAFMTSLQLIQFDTARLDSGTHFPIRGILEVSKGDFVTLFSHICLTQCYCRNKVN